MENCFYFNHLQEKNDQKNYKNLKNKKINYK